MPPSEPTSSRAQGPTKRHTGAVWAPGASHVAFWVNANPSHNSRSTKHTQLPA